MGKPIIPLRFPSNEDKDKEIHAHWLANKSDHNAVAEESNYANIADGKKER